jgi:hypothetical protein
VAENKQTLLDMEPEGHIKAMPMTDAQEQQMQQIKDLKMKLARTGVHMENHGLTRAIMMPTIIDYEIGGKRRYPKDGDALWSNPFKKKKKKGGGKKSKRGARRSKVGSRSKSPTKSVRDVDSDNASPTTIGSPTKLF